MSNKPPRPEFLHSEWVRVPAEWPIFSNWAECFSERMNTLHRISRYAPSLAAKTPEEFITLVSEAWATDPHRGEAVLETYKAHLADLT
jgi:flagellum-specific peptidoglycan hydrolase FlgJ